MSDLNEIATIIAAVATDAETSGLFERFVDHEPIDAPGNGLTGAVWLNDIVPVPDRSGLASTSYCVMLTVRLYMNADHQPAGDIDVLTVRGANTLFKAYNGGFTLGGLIEQVDVLGAYGEKPLSVAFKWATQNQKLYRVVTFALPLICDDLYPQGS